MERPEGCPVEFADIESWNEETARKAGLCRLFEDELYMRALYLFPHSWAPFIPVGFPVVNPAGQPRYWSDTFKQACSTSHNNQDTLLYGVWILYRGDDVAPGQVNSDTD